MLRVTLLVVAVLVVATVLIDLNGRVRVATAPPLSPAEYTVSLQHACSVARPVFDAAIKGPATPRSTADFVASHSTLRDYTTTLTRELARFKPPVAVQPAHAAYVASLKRLTAALDTAISTVRGAPFSAALAQQQSAPVLAAMTRAGAALTALHEDTSGCVVL